jgi:hypothetical protein
MVCLKCLNVYKWTILDSVKTVLSVSLADTKSSCSQKMEFLVHEDFQNEPGVGIAWRLHLNSIKEMYLRNVALLFR